METALWLAPPLHHLRHRAVRLGQVTKPVSLCQSHHLACAQEMPPKDHMAIKVQQSAQRRHHKFPGDLWKPIRESSNTFQCSRHVGSKTALTPISSVRPYIAVWARQQQASNLLVATKKLPVKLLKK
ncbi:hypothetical protein WJX73_001984 [Symbiochloris irregularis]|uniref:Uncharacterized protein n=1 Tax=Symbiochloris irregularis TaxID=706552 RepID=A0AAW1NJD1_9CHLO